MKKKSKIYVAGHRGLVGSALVRMLKERGYTDIIVKAREELDLLRQDQIEEFFALEKPEYVFLAAAKVGGILANSTYKAEFIYDNLTIANNVIHAAYKCGVKKLLNLGSSCIYPKLCPQPIKEEYLLTGPLESTNEPYAIAKITAIKLCRYYNEQYGTNYISVMPTNLYGVGDNFNFETAHVLPALLRKFYLARLLSEGNYNAIQQNVLRYPLGFKWDSKGIVKDMKKIEDILYGLGVTKDKVVVWGSGAPYREFLYVDDLADACVFLMEKWNYHDIGECINVGMGEDIQIKDLVQIIKRIVGFKGDIIWDNSRPDGTPRKLLDISKIKSLGWQPTVSIKAGIEKAYQQIAL